MKTKSFRSTIFAVVALFLTAAAFTGCEQAEKARAGSIRTDEQSRIDASKFDLRITVTDADGKPLDGVTMELHARSSDRATRGQPRSGKRLYNRNSKRKRRRTPKKKQRRTKSQKRRRIQRKGLECRKGHSCPFMRRNLEKSFLAITFVSFSPA